MIHFDLDDRYQDELVVGSAISRREGVVAAVILHALVLVAFMYGPRLAIFQPDPEELARRQQELERQRQQEPPATFVFVQPRVDLKALAPPPRAELSDLDRQARTREAAPVPENPLPFMRGNSVNRVEAAEEEKPAGAESPTPPQPETEVARVTPPSNEGILRPPERPRPQTSSGALGEAVRNFQRYVERETFNNPQGGQNTPGAEIQFDSKGVEFGPWLRRFVSRVRRNWFIPLSAMSFRGHVVLQFNIWKDGHITDVNVVQPSSIDSFNNAAYNAILTSNPVDPLPPEYPSEKALFTVTFYYNEQPLGP